MFTAIFIVLSFISFIALLWLLFTFEVLLLSAAGVIIFKGVFAFTVFAIVLFVFTFVSFLLLLITNLVSLFLSLERLFESDLFLF